MSAPLPVALTPLASPPARLCLVSPELAGQGSSLQSVGWEMARVSERGGGGVAAVTAWSVCALGGVQRPAEVPVLATDQLLARHLHVPWCANGPPVLSAERPRRGTPSRVEGDHLLGRAASFTWAAGPVPPGAALCRALSRLLQCLPPASGLVEASTDWKARGVDEPQNAGVSW